MKDDTPRNEPARLNDLSLPELERLCQMLDAMASAGHVLDGAGLAPRFSLWPGAEPKITVTGGQMPHMHGPRDLASILQMPETAAQAPKIVINGVVGPAPQAPLAAEPVPAPAYEPGSAPPSPADVALIRAMVEDDILAPEALAGIEAAPARDAEPAPPAEPARAHAWGASKAEPAPAPEPVPAPTTEPGPVRVNRQKQPGDQNSPGWSAAEDAQAIRLRRAGHSVPAIAEALGRPLGGVQFRFKNKLSDWATRKLSATDVAAPETAPAPEPEPQPDPAPVIETVFCAEVAAANAPLQDPAPAPEPQPAAPLQAWDTGTLPPRLRSLDFALPASTDPELDLDLAEAVIRGAHLSEIAADFGMDGAALGKRWQALRAPFMAPGAKALSLQAQDDMLAILRHRARSTRRAALDAPQA